MQNRALVMGSGGIAGISWIIGLMKGFAEHGLDPLDADLIIATSAGASAAALLGSKLPIELLFDRQTDSALQTSEPSPDPDLLARAAAIRPSLLSAGSIEAIRRARCDYALSVQTVSEPERRKVFEARLPVHRWPDLPLKLVAVDTATAEGRSFDRESAVDFVDAVAASSSVPGIWPPTTIGGRRYTDGVVRSPENADLAAGCGRILIVSPAGEAFQSIPPRDLRADIAALERGGAEVLLVQPDDASRLAITTNLLDPATRGPAALAGREQGRRIAAAVEAFWRAARAAGEEAAAAG